MLNREKRGKRRKKKKRIERGLLSGYFPACLSSQLYLSSAPE